MTDQLYYTIATLLRGARKNTLKAINHTMVSTYYEIGKHLVQEEQNGKARADYGKQIIVNLSEKLSNEFGKGFSKRNLEQMRQLYLVYSKTQTVSAQFKLSWSHYLKLMRIDNIEERSFYEIEAAANNWSLRELKRQVDTALYQRLALSKDKNAVKQLSIKGQLIEQPKDAIKDPYILEFLQLPEKESYSESDLEVELIDKLEAFLLELGKGYTFVGRQQRFTFNEKHFRVDLVFYNRILRCFVLIDLKIGEISHQDLGQMQMYVHYYDRFVKMEQEEKTIGIVLCREKDDLLVEITLPEDNKQIFASQYQMVLPDKASLVDLLQKQTK